jgi:acyl-CoA hydrolase
MKKKKVSKPYNLLMYTVDASPKIRKFKTEKAMGEFIDEFYRQHPDHADQYSDNWIDYAVTEVTGEVHFFTDGLKVQ